jgi:TolB-like protein
MQSERWQSCTAIFTAAVEGPRVSRAALLEQRCDGDVALRRKVELLLKYHDEADQFIDSPAFEVAPELLLDDPDALIGEQLGSYRIDAVLGAGGMGVVYLAYDERLGRKVGLKLLPQSVVTTPRRFEKLKREARMASALNHPNIMTIHEVGEVDGTHYIATEFIEGTTLRQRITKGAIPRAQAVEIATQIASALSVAHRAGIVHRDVKPENIMLRPDGYVKVLDFGIAHFTQEEALEARRSAVAVLTGEQGKILGTARYMSPEQARGDTVDARSDLWSLGVVLYEMLAGHPPFEGETPTDVIAAVLLKDPPSLEQRPAIVSPALRNVVQKCLRKDPAARYQTADELLAELRAVEAKPALINNRRSFAIAACVALLLALAAFYGLRERYIGLASAPASIEAGIAVLPFENLSADKSDAFLADGMQDDVLTSVGKIKDLKVIARASVMDYRGAQLAGKVRNIGQSLRVSHVLEGSVRRVADRVVVNVALIDTRDEHQVWAQRYERSMRDALSLQGELAVQIAQELRTTLTPAEATAAAAKPTQNPEAYLLYLRGREIEIANDLSDKVQPAIELYQQAVDLDPKFALARARLSFCASRLVYSDVAGEWKVKARAEAEEALRLQPRLGEARLALAHCYLWIDGNYQRALAELNRAAELLPNSAEIPLTAAYIYKRQNRYRDRIGALRRAEALDPRNLRVLGLLMNTFQWLRDWPQAMQTCEKSLAVDARESVFCWRRFLANDKFQFTGDINTLKQEIAELANGSVTPNPDTLNFARYETAMLGRDYAEAARFLSAIPPEKFPDVAYGDNEGHSKAFHEALLAVASNTGAAVRQQALEIARTETETRLSSGRWRNVDQKAHADLALLDAFLGRKEEAIREALRAVDVAAPPANSTEKNDMSSALATVYAQAGEQEKAIDLIEHLLTVPTEVQRGAVYNMTLTDLKWRWQWDPLRNNARFQKLLAGPEPKTVY